MIMDGLGVGETFASNEPASQEAQPKHHQQADSFPNRESHKYGLFRSSKSSIDCLDSPVGKMRVWRRRQKGKRRREAEPKSGE